MVRAVLYIGGGVVWLLVGLSLLTALTLGYARATGLILLSVQTGSMRPYIRPGDAVLVRPTKQTGQDWNAVGKLQQGDIVTYRQADNPAVTITHRVVAVHAQSGRLTTRGDALAAPDPVVLPSQIVGRVEHRVPLAGASFDFVRRPAGLLAMVYVPAAVLIAAEIRRLMRHFTGQRYRLRAYPW